MYVAAYNGHLPAVQCLTKAGAAVNQAMQDGATPLHSAAHNGHLPVVRCLVAAGADVEWKIDGCTPAQYAAEEGHADVANWLQRSAGWDALHHACDGRCTTQHLAALLHDHFHPARVSASGETPLQICALADAALGALPEDPALTAMLQTAMRPWHRKRHGLFPRTFAARRVVPLLLVHQRHEQQQVRVMLTQDLWLKVVPFLPRFGAGHCAYCGKAAAVGAKLPRCARCRTAKYCSSECQIAHWKGGHKQVCGK